MMAQSSNLGTSLECIQVPIGQPVKVHLASIFSSHNLFFHLNKDVDSFQKILNEKYLKSHMNNSPLDSSNIKNKMLCCIYDPDRQKFFRGQIHQASELNKFLVRLVDFGNMLTVDKKNIFTLDPVFEKQPIFAIHSYFKGTFFNF